MIRTLVAAPAVLILTACGAGSTNAAAPTETTSTSTASSSSSAPAPKPRPKPAAPKLGAPGNNAGKGNFKTIRIGCIEYVVSPVLNEGDPIDEIMVGNACNRKKLLWTQAKATVPKGMAACLSDVGYALEHGPNIDVRREGNYLGDCRDDETRYKG